MFNAQLEIRDGITTRWNSLHELKWRRRAICPISNRGIRAVACPTCFACSLPVLRRAAECYSSESCDVWIVHLESPGIVAGSQAARRTIRARFREEDWERNRCECRWAVDKIQGRIFEYADSSAICVLAGALNTCVCGDADVCTNDADGCRLGVDVPRSFSTQKCLNVQKMLQQEFEL